MDKEIDQKLYEMFCAQTSPSDFRWLIIKGQAAFEKAFNAFKKKHYAEVEASISQDPEAIKHVEEVLSMELPSDYTNIFLESDEISEEIVSIEDSLIHSLRNKGKVDIEYMASIAHTTPQEVIKSLKGAIYQNPKTWDEKFYLGWETRDEYLSGNIREKIDLAKECNKHYPGYFEDNIKALKSVFPDQIAPEEIYVSLGSPLLTEDIVSDFARATFNFYKFPVTYDSYTGSWELRIKSADIQSELKYGTKRMKSIAILEHLLNGTTIAVYDRDKQRDYKTGKVKTVSTLNEGETTLALEKAKLIEETFQTWLKNNPDQMKKVIKLFDSRYASNVVRKYDGSFLTFPDLNPEITLFKYQKDAVARIILSGNTLLAHDVGSGKTYAMIAAGHEIRRIGIAKKILYVVPNNILKQWEGMFKKLYPSINLLMVQAKDFVPSKKEETLKTIKDKEFDAILMPYSVFDRIPLSPDFYKKHYSDMAAKLREGKDTKTVSSRIKSVEEKRIEIFKEVRDPNATYFDDLGIDYLFLDEAHNYKNVPLESKLSLSGISTDGSKKCFEMMLKTSFIQENHNGVGLVFATGTPITNSLSDAFIMQKYLQSGTLELLQLSSFDAWCKMFAEQVQQFEIDVDTLSYRMKTRFAKFHNIPELSSLLAAIADFHHIEHEVDLPDFDGYEDVIIKKTPQFETFLKSISKRADDVRNHVVKNKDDNLLKITTDGRKGALDLRIVNPEMYHYTDNCKANQLAEKAAEIYFDTASDRLTQLIFSDISTPKAGFNIYDEIKRLLVDRGVDANEIAYIHSYEKDSEKEKLFQAVNDGKIRILIGSTSKLGLGVNIQKRLIALHHIDVPWRPADMVQREGRIIRPGNLNEKIRIFRYITESSFDAYSWQLLETKQNFISKLLTNDVYVRDNDDIDDLVLSYAEVKALAIGNPLVKTRVEVSNEINRLRSLQSKTVERQNQLKMLSARYHDELPSLKERLKLAKRDGEYAKTTSSLTSEERRQTRIVLEASITKATLEGVVMKLGEIRGFEVWSMNIAIDNKTYIEVRHEGKYQLESSGSPIGMITRVENFIDKFPETIEELALTIDKKKKYIEAAKVELENPVSYLDEIKDKIIELAAIDKKLGVKKDGEQD
ncbi:MAG: DEAD/DEAH box helicase family protein [Bacilli bacterium]|nr:DEAD/DEAH box helicase family protein [Bacilli bacterium]